MREKLIELILSAMPPCYSDVFATQIADHLIANDVVPVVRCKDCKYSFKNNGHERSGCPINDASTWMDGDDFCSYGERKDNERKAD